MVMCYLPLYNAMNYCYHVINTVSMEAVKMIRTQIQLTPKQAEKIKALAAERRQSMAEVIRESIDAMIEGNKRPDRAERLRRALSFAGKFSAQETDISTRHDDYLSEDFAR